MGNADSINKFSSPAHELEYLRIQMDQHKRQHEAKEIARLMAQQNLAIQNAPWMSERAWREQKPAYTTNKKLLLIKRRSK